MTKRRETHARDLDGQIGSDARDASRAKVKPRLRVEPCPSYYLRTARSYDFLLNFLLAAVGEDGLASLHGLHEGGERSKTLLEELRSMRELFYGLHLLSAEDIGMAPALRPDEPVDRAACEAKATRMAGLLRSRRRSESRYPRFGSDLLRRQRIGERGSGRRSACGWRSSTSRYARPPKIKPAEGAGEWNEVEPDQLEAVQYVIAVDEFAEVEIPGLQPLTRQEFRTCAMPEKTKPEILEALSRRVTVSRIGESGRLSRSRCSLQHSVRGSAEHTGWPSGMFVSQQSIGKFAGRSLRGQA